MRPRGGQERPPIPEWALDPALWSAAREWAEEHGVDPLELLRARVEKRNGAGSPCPVLDT